jgi:hypothetical protein
METSWWCISTGKDKWLSLALWLPVSFSFWLDFYFFTGRKDERDEGMGKWRPVLQNDRRVS